MRRKNPLTTPSTPGCVTEGEASTGERCKGSRVLFLLLWSPKPWSRSGGRLLPVIQSRLLLRWQENTSAGFRWNLAVGTFNWWYIPHQSTRVSFTPPPPPPTHLGLLCPCPATTQRWYKRGSLAICILLPLLFQTAVLTFTSYKPIIPATLATKAVPFAEGLGRWGKPPSGVSREWRKVSMLLTTWATVKAPFRITGF